MLLIRRPDGLSLNLEQARLMKDDRENGGVVCWGWCGPISERCYLIDDITVREISGHYRRTSAGCAEPTLHRDWRETAYVLP